MEKSTSFPRTFFDVILLVEKSTLFPGTFFDVISIVKKSILFPHKFFDAISLVGKPMLFPLTFFDVILIVENSRLLTRTFFGVNSLLEKSMLFPRTFFEVISLVEISTLFPLTFLYVILLIEKSTFFPRTFFNEISMGKILRGFSLSCKLMKTFKEVFFVSNFKNMTFPRLLSWNFSSKYSWWSPVLLKFESYNLQNCKKNCCKLVFWVFAEQQLCHIDFWWLHCYEVTLIKRCDKALLQESETKIFDQKGFVKTSFKVNEKNSSGVLRINQTIPKLLTLRKCSLLNC